MSSYRRLPHVYPPDTWLFLTWHLYGGIPPARFPPPHKLSAGQAFVWIDRYLDQARSGPMFLKEPRVAQIVADSLFRGVELGHYRLAAFTIMPNHVHVLLLPLVPPPQLLKSLKGFTARSANFKLGRTREPFWLRESYDHWVRDTDEVRRIASYIERNPVKAGLVSEAAEYPWSSANLVFAERIQSASVRTSANTAR